MPARAAWKGFLQIHQLQVPVKAFTAVTTRPEIELHQLHADCGQRIRQMKVCPTHGELKSDAIISGYECSEGTYLPIAAADLAALHPEDGKAITVDCIVEKTVVDPVYHSGRTYYLVPDGPPGQRPFGVFREGLRSVDRTAISRVVMAGRELLVQLRPLGRLIAMTVLEYPQRVHGISDYESEVASVAPGSEEQALMLRLLDLLADPQFDIDRYSNPYINGLTRLIEQRLAESQAANSDHAESSDPMSGDDADLIAALRSTLAAAGPSRPSAVGTREMLAQLAASENDPKLARKHA